MHDFMDAIEGKAHKTFLCIIVLVSILALCTPLNSYAKVSGVCSNCHTMHNSQNGSAMARDNDGNLTATPNSTLLIYSCIGCHSATDPSTAQHTVTNAPIVYNINGAPTYGAGSLGLAGGNFYWVAQGSDVKGHNIFAQDSNLSEAPGKLIGSCSGAGSCHMNLFEAIPPASFGFSHVRQGCTKCHMIASDPPQGYHHRDDTGPVIDSFSEGWYRFLTGHNTNQGVTGIEDADWQYTFGSNDHNEYLGSSGNKTATGGFALGNTMTAYCCGCHGVFHIQDTTVTGASPWLRHPSDAVLPVSGEYSAYTTYDPVTPVARPSLSGWSGPSNTVTPGQDMVMCLSCHKPHGSDYPDLLRWDYTDMIAGDNTKSGGCFNCHTQKNQTP